MRWRPERTADGSWTLAHPVHGETCHSRDGAWTEAVERYATPCRLRERALAGELASARLLDVGTGLGWNLAAALRALDGTGVPLEARGLEAEPAVLRSLETLPAAPDAAGERWHRIVRRAIADALADPRGAEERGVPLVGRGRLRLAIGDARETLARASEDERYDAVFLDPFSPGVEPELWDATFARAVAARMAAGAWLSTFSASLRARRALAAAGLRVGRGPRVGRKREGTLASPDRDPPPLDARAARRIAAEGRARAEDEGIALEGRREGGLESPG